MKWLIILIVSVVAILCLIKIINLLVSKYEDYFKNVNYNDRKTTATNEKFVQEIEQKGRDGEHIIEEIIGETVPGKQYVVNNLKLSNKDGTRSTEIDHIVINEHGFFVIETKNWSGKIKGCDEDEKWLQFYDGSDVVNQHINPVKQNEGHIRTLSWKLGSNIPMTSVIVFINADLSNVKSQYVVNVHSLRDKLNFGVFPFSDEQIKGYYNELMVLKANEISHEQHVNNIHNIYG